MEINYSFPQDVSNLNKLSGFTTRLVFLYLRALLISMIESANLFSWKLVSILDRFWNGSTNPLGGC